MNTVMLNKIESHEWAELPVRTEALSPLRISLWSLRGRSPASAMNQISLDPLCLESIFRSKPSDIVLLQAGTDHGLGITVVLKAWENSNVKFRFNDGDRVNEALAERQSVLDLKMTTLSALLLNFIKIELISCGCLPHFVNKVLSNILHDKNLRNPSLLPNWKTKLYQHKSGSELLYSEEFTDAKKGQNVSPLKLSPVDLDSRTERVIEALTACWTDSPLKEWNGKVGKAHE